MSGMPVLNPALNPVDDEVGFILLVEGTVD